MSDWDTHFTECTKLAIQFAGQEMQAHGRQELTVKDLLVGIIKSKQLPNIDMLCLRKIRSSDIAKPEMMTIYPVTYGPRTVELEDY